MAGGYGELFALIARAKREYPELAYLLDNDEVGPLLLKAVSGAIDAVEFEFKLHQTRYWKESSRPQRTWDAFFSTDPGTAKAQIQQQREQIDAIARSMGVELGLRGRQWLAVTFLRNGWSDEQLTRAIAKRAEWEGPDDLPGGDIGATFDQYRQTARDFGVKMRGRDIFNRARATVSGTQTTEGFAAEMRHRAMERFAGNDAIVQALKNGASLREYFSPIQNEVAAQLELPPEAVDIVNGERWSDLISFTDPTSGNVRPASISEARRWARGTQQFRKTERAREEVATVAETLLQSFGEVA